MTRNKAIDELKYLAACSYVDEFEPSEKEALNMAIAALKQLTSYEHTINEFNRIIRETR